MGKITIFIRFVVTAILTISIWGCTSEITPELRTGYFPLSQGNVYIWEADTVHWFNNAVSGTTRHSVKDSLVMYSADDVTGEVQGVFYRYIQEEESAEWVAYDTYSITQSRDGRVIRNFEGNVHVILSEPLNSFKSWDGNALNSQPETPFTSVKLDDYSQLGVDWEWAYSVEHEFQDDLTRKEIEVVVYVAGNGPMTWGKTVYNYCNETECLGELIIETGYESLYTLKEIHIY